MYAQRRRASPQRAAFVPGPSQKNAIAPRCPTNDAALSLKSTWLGT